MAQVAWSSDEDPETPQHILERMREALAKPVLDAREFESEAQTAPEIKSTSYTITPQKDPDSDDVVLPLPENLLTEEDWRVGDRLKFEVIAEGRFSLTNLSKAEREGQGCGPGREKAI